MIRHSATIQRRSGGWLLCGLYALLATIGAALSVAVLPATALAASSPSIEWTNAWNLAPTGATLGAGINPEGLTYGAYYQFQIVKNTSEYLPEMDCSEGGVVQPVGRGCGGNWGTPPVVIPLGGEIGGSKGQQVSVDLAAAAVTLQPGATYHYRVLAAKRLPSEEGGIFWEHPSVIGSDQTFTTPLAFVPSIENESALHVTQNDATLGAKINPEDLPEGVYYQFQVVKNTSEYLPELACPESSVPPYNSDGCGGPDSGPTTPGALPIGFIEKGSEGRTVSLDLEMTGMALKSGTTYHYRVLAVKRRQSEDTVNWEGPPAVGPDQTFTTPPAGKAPVIDSVSLSHLTSTDATLEAKIDTEGLPTLYEFHMWSSCAHEACEYMMDIPLPSGLLLGSFVDQSVSLDLNSAGVTLNSGEEYGYSVTATNAAGNAHGHWQIFEPPPAVTEPLGSTVTPGPSGPTSGASNDGRGGPASSSPPGVRSLGPPVGNTTKLKALTNAQKLAKALKVCAKKPKKQRASCKKQAKKQYSTTGKKR